MKGWGRGGGGGVVAGAGGVISIWGGCEWKEGSVVSLGLMVW